MKGYILFNFDFWGGTPRGLQFSGQGLKWPHSSESLESPQVVIF